MEKKGEIPTDAAGLGLVQSEALVAGAHEAAEGVRAVSIEADVIVLLALVDVFQDDSHAVGSIAKSARTKGLEFLGSRLGALLAVIAPGVADAAAARCLRHRCRQV